MVNAVLRKLAKAPHSAKEIEGKRALCQGTTLVVPQTTQNKGGALAPAGFFSEILPQFALFSATCLAPDGNLSGELEAYPAWLVERWIGFYGLEAAQSICLYGQSQPALAVRPASAEVAEKLATAGIVLEAGALLTAAHTVVSGDVAATEVFREGQVRFQDEGSQLVAELAGWNRKNLSQKVKSILDACAAPGGKTLILAERNPQAHIVAFEASAPRLEQLQKRLAHLGSRVECRLADATALNEEPLFDLVLADVPCSGTGTLGRNPEIRHRLRPEDLTRQAERQRAILSAALRAVRPGGRVVYSTCSLEPEENEQVVAAVLAATPNARVFSLDNRIGEVLGERILTQEGAQRLLASLTPEGYLRLLPGRFQTDGFFICMIERTA
jgi:16S rRNA (cytosine967-C5)-methyltransferase